MFLAGFSMWSRQKAGLSVRLMKLLQHCMLPLFITAQVWFPLWRDVSLFHSHHLAQCVLCEEVSRHLNPREWWNRPQSDAFKEAIVPIMIRWSLLKSEQLRMKHVAPCQRCSWLFISRNGVCNWIQNVEYKRYKQNDDTVHNYQQLVILKQIH